MNQKLRMARSGVVILFAILCIVCLSLSLALSAGFAAYAEDAESAELPINDGTNDLWLIYYEGNETGESLWNGIREGQSISYIDSVRSDDGSYIVREGTEEDVNVFAPYRGINLTLALNPEYLINGETLSSLYDLEHATYVGNTAIGESDMSTDMRTTVTVSPSEGSSATEELSLVKTWKIATLCNAVDISGTYIGDRGYAAASNLALLNPELGSIVVYDISSTASYEKIVAVQNVDGAINYFQAGKDEINGRYFLSIDENGDYISWDQSEQDAAAAANVNLINYFISGLDALEATADTKAYTLTVTAMDIPAESGEIQYVQSSKSYDFSVTRQSLGDDAVDDLTFDTNFKYDCTLTKSVEYTKGNEWVEKLGFKLWLHGVLLTEGKDYTIIPESSGVGLVDLRIVGDTNLVGYHTIKGTESNIRIIPARNYWSTPFSIITWTYGTYKAENNKIVGVPEFLDNPSDVTFRIVKILKDKSGNETGTEAIEALSAIHYYVDSDGKTNWIVTDDVITALGKLDAGDYRLYASVYGVYATDATIDRNYEPIQESSVDFTVFVGTNRWKAGAEPSINGGWTTGKLESTEGLMNAESVFGTPILMIYDIDDNLIYSNKPEHANSEFGDINVLKGLKAGRYYLSATVNGTANYDELKATVLFDVIPNNLPIWAVILIVAGSLGIVALVFGILHQKGVLQMLTGKVILSMRTRANVDATLAAIRAAKMARESEASVAAAKAREAEEQANAEKKENK